MSAYKNHVYDDSDADDEYDERSIITSPTLPPDFPSSPTDSDAMSTEHTPTTYSHRDNSPRGSVTQWSAEQVADFISSLALPQYADQFIEEAITGDTLTTLLHSDLKEMGITSIGHRMTILKGTYDLKIKQNIPIEAEHFVPLSAESETIEPPTHDDISHIIRIIQDRDAEMRLLRDIVERLQDENRKLREDVLPLIKQAKDRSQPLPTPEERDFASSAAVEAVKTGGLSRKFSTKRLFLSNTGPKNPSPTIQERSLTDPSNLDPPTNHLTASLRDATSPNHSVPSPTSPAYQQIIAPNSDGPRQRGFASSDRDTWNAIYGTSTRTGDLPLSGNSLKTSLTSSSTNVSAPSNATPMSLPNPSSVNTSSSAAPSAQPGASTPSLSSSNTSAPSRDQVEIFKSFRVSIDDPCHKVLPVALKKYNITADWRQYALYIVHGDQERCLGLNEKPLILFKQLDREGRKPMFMLRKHATPAEGHYTSIGGGGGAGVGGVGGTAIPGGVL